MKNRLLLGGTTILILGIIMMGTSVYIIIENIHSTNKWNYAGNSIYFSDEIKINEDTLLIISHGGEKCGVINYSYYQKNVSLENISISPIETTDHEAIYDLENGSYIVFILSNYTPKASINYISIGVLLEYGSITLAGLVLFLAGIILVPMSIMSGKAQKK